MQTQKQLLHEVSPRNQRTEASIKIKNLNDMITSRHRYTVHAKEQIYL